MPTRDSPPRPILGPTGSRIRVILGDTGDDFLLVVNPDDGTREWQVTDWNCGNNMGGVTRQIRNCENKERYVTELDFHSTTGAWYVAGVKRDGSGYYHWWGSNATNESAIRDTPDAKVSFGSRRNDYGGIEEMSVVIEGRNDCHAANIPVALENRIQRIKSRNKKIHFIRLFDRGGYFISDSEGTQWCVLNPGLTQELRKPGGVHDVAVAKNGSWVVIRCTGFASSPSVHSRLVESLELFYSRQKRRMEARQREIQEYHDAEQQERDRLAREAIERERLEDESRDIVLSLRSKCQEIQRLRNAIDEQQKLVRAHLDSLSPLQRAHVEAEIGWERLQTHKAVCVICHDSSVEHALVPCGHHCLCDDCSVQLMNATRTCHSVERR